VAHAEASFPERIPKSGLCKLDCAKKQPRPARGQAKLVRALAVSPERRAQAVPAEAGVEGVPAAGVVGVPAAGVEGVPAEGDPGRGAQEAPEEAPGAALEARAAVSTRKAVLPLVTLECPSGHELKLTTVTSAVVAVQGDTSCDECAKMVFWIRNVGIVTYVVMTFAFAAPSVAQSDRAERRITGEL
jgi:hypothetical protein